MIRWDEELEEIFADPLFADVTAPKRRPDAGDRLISGFQQITDFVEAHGCAPSAKGDLNERRLFNQLQGILRDPVKRERCRPYDSCGLLAEAAPAVESTPSLVKEESTEYKAVPRTEEEELVDILNDPLFADTAGEESAGLFDIPEYMQKRLDERREADFVAQRVRCEDFARFEPGFKEVQAGLKSGRYRLIKFREAHIAQGRYFVEDGILVYLAAMDRVVRNRHGRNDTRTRCIYENGVESGIYLQTLCRNLYTTGYTVQDVSEVDEDFLKKHFTVQDKDVESGLIYVLRSKSTDPEIAALKDLYKIGFTTTPLVMRLAGAAKEPTYLCAEVETVATWRVYNVKSSTFEALIHKLFDCVQLQVLVDGRRPKEWFVVPYNIIEQAVYAIVEGRSVSYDPRVQQLVYGE
jgi:hypothetical protein